MAPNRDYPMSTPAFLFLSAAQADSATQLETLKVNSSTTSTGLGTLLIPAALTWCRPAGGGR